MKITKRLIIIVLFAILLIILFRVLKVQNLLLKKLYPTNYQEYVEECSKEFGIDKLLIYSIIKAESNFEENANSKSGAKGLMQIMDSTAEDIANNLGIDEQRSYNLYDAQTNIRFGTKYFSDLLSEYNNNEKLALAAYNAGKGNVNKWIEQGKINKDGSNIENIPFKETNMYVRKILQNYRIYNELNNM